MTYASPKGILDEVRGARGSHRGEQAHRRACPLCRGARSNSDARKLAALESRFIRWAPTSVIAEAATVSVDELEDHARVFGLDQLRLAHLDAAAARALDLALAGDPCCRVALSALDRLRELSAPDQPAGGSAPAAGPAPEPDSWEASIGISPETAREAPGKLPHEPNGEP